MNLLYVSAPLQNNTYSKMLNLWSSYNVNTADTTRGRKTCRKDRGTSKGPANTTSGIWMSSVIWCWRNTITSCIHEWDFFYYFDWSDFCRDQPGEYQSNSPYTYTSLHDSFSLYCPNTQCYHSFSLPLFSKHQPASCPSSPVAFPLASPQEKIKETVKSL